MDSSPITIVRVDAFEQDPFILYGLFRRRHSIEYDPNQTLFLKQTTEDDEPRVFHAETIDELTHVKNELLSKPAVWPSSIRHQRRTYLIYCILTTTYRQEYVVLLNTSHPSIAEPLNLAIEQAYEHILKEEKYCIDLDIRSSIKEYFLEATKPKGCCGITVTSGTHIWITNHSKYAHCFDCKWIWCIGFPCWMLTAPCYMVHRAKTCKDINLDLPVLPVQRPIRVRSNTSPTGWIVASRFSPHTANQIITTQPQTDPADQPAPYTGPPPSG